MLRFYMCAYLFTVFAKYVARHRSAAGHTYKVSHPPRFGLHRPPFFHPVCHFYQLRSLPWPLFCLSFFLFQRFLGASPPLSAPMPNLRSRTSNLLLMDSAAPLCLPVVFFLDL